MYIIEKNFLNINDCKFFLTPDTSDERFHKSMDAVLTNVCSLIEKEFNLDYKLYLDHVMIRSYDDGKTKNGMNMHQDHLDWFNSSSNSWISCSHRLFTSVINLNTNFIGGNFKIADDNNPSPSESIPPRLGQLIVLPSSLYHGVQSIGFGKRYTILMWWRKEPNPLGSCSSELYLDNFKDDYSHEL